MKIRKNEILASVIVVNYNNAKYLNQNLKSILEQTHKNIQIVVVDDNSTDDSLKVLKKYKKKVTIIKNKKKKKIGSFNQINAYYKGFLKSKGNYLFFVDSDDYFKKNKIKLLLKEFKKNSDLNLIFDLPILKYEKNSLQKKFRQKKMFFSSWPRFSPQSCISIKKDFAKEIFKNLKVQKFETIWFDFRIANYAFKKFGKIYIFKEYLTYYRQLSYSASKDYKLFSKLWWFRRNQAHNFITFLSHKMKTKDRFTLDKLITKIINIFL